MSDKPKGWTAEETETDFSGNQHELTVKGTSQKCSRNQTAKLSEGKPQGISPKTLILDLSLEDDGGGKPDVTWKKEISPNQYTDVTIRGDGDDINIKVQQVHSLVGKPVKP